MALTSGRTWATLKALGGRVPGLVRCSSSPPTCHRLSTIRSNFVSQRLPCRQAFCSSAKVPSPEDRGTTDPDRQQQPEESFEEHERTVYEGLLSAQIKLVKAFSLTTSAIGISCQPFLLQQLQTTNSNVALILAGGVAVSFFTFVTPLLIHSVSKKYVTKLLYNEADDTYTAVTYSLMLRQKKIKFRLKDVMVPDLPGMFTTFKVMGTPLFVDGATFVEPVHFGKIMGLDKPLDLRWRGDDPKEGAQSPDEDTKTKEP